MRTSSRQGSEGALVRLFTPISGCTRAGATILFSGDTSSPGPPPSSPRSSFGSGLALGTLAPVEYPLENAIWAGVKHGSAPLSLPPAAGPPSQPTRVAFNNSVESDMRRSLKRKRKQRTTTQRRREKEKMERVHIIFALFF